MKKVGAPRAAGCGRDPLAKAHLRASKDAVSIQGLSDEDHVYTAWEKVAMWEDLRAFESRGR